MTLLSPGWFPESVTESSQASPDRDKWAHRRAQRRSQPAGPYPRIRLKHLHNRRDFPGMYRETFSLTPIHTPRPDRGVRTAAVRCEGCGEDVQIRVLSLRDTVRARLHWLLPAVVAGIAAPVLFYYTFGTTDAGTDPDPVLLFCAPAALAFAVGAFVGFYNEDGVRLFRNSGHSLTR